MIFVFSGLWRFWMVDGERPFIWVAEQEERERSSVKPFSKGDMALSQKGTDQVFHFYDQLAIGLQGHPGNIPKFSESFYITVKSMSVLGIDERYYFRNSSLFMRTFLDQRCLGHSGNVPTFRSSSPSP
jgi:hypothetical protein